MREGASAATAERRRPRRERHARRGRDPDRLGVHGGRGTGVRWRCGRSQRERLGDRELALSADGEYKVTERLVSSDCQPKFTPPSEPWTVQVQAGAEKNYAKVNVPLSAIPPSNATGSSARSDVVIEPRKPIKSTYVPMPQCPSYSLTRTMEIAEASAKSFKLLITVEHGNAIMCSALHPSKCTTKVEQVYEVVHASCAAECTRGIVFRGAGDAGATRLDVDCRCP